MPTVKTSVKIIEIKVRKALKLYDKIQTGQSRQLMS